MSTEQPIGNFSILERIQHEHLPFPSREELLDFIYDMEQHIRDENQFGTDECDCDCEETELDEICASVLSTSRMISGKQEQIHKEIQDLKKLINELLGERYGQKREN